MRFLVVVAFVITGGLMPSARLLAQPPQLVAPTGPLSPEDERKGFTLPAGFEAQLVAAEPDIQKPMQMAFDAKGRIWVTTSYHYPFAAETGKSTDKLYVLSDIGPDGKARKVQVFADFLNIPIGILPLPDCNSCLVSSVGEILKLTDTDGDGKSDKKEVLFTGFGSRDTHGMYNSFTLMPDGWVYACHGFNNDSTVKGKDGHEVKMHSGHTFRFRPDGSRIEVHTRGQVNPFGMCVDPWFNLYTADCHSKPITQLIPGAYYQSFGKPHDGLGFAQHITPHDHGSTGLCGLAWYEADHFPKQFKGCLFVGNVVTNRINFDKIEWRGATPVAKELPDFMSSKDPWFRPVDIKLGPDGALYVNDFYNKIIGHYEVDLKHPGRDKDRGRMWRIVYKSEPAPAAGGPRMPRADWTKLLEEQLIDDLMGPNMTVRLLAANELNRRAKTDNKPPLSSNNILTHLMDKNTASAMAGWASFVAEAKGEDINYRQIVEHARNFDPKLTSEQHTGLLMRAMASKEKWTDAERSLTLDIVKWFDAPHLSRAVVEAMAAHPHADFVKPLVEILKKTPASDTHLTHMARIGLRNCLRDADGWKVVAEGDVATVTEVALGIPSEQAAEFLVKQLRTGAEPTRLPAFAEHIGRYGTEEMRKVVIRKALPLLKKPDEPLLMALHALVRGTQTSGRRLDADQSSSIAMFVSMQLVLPDEPTQANTRPHLAAARLLVDLTATTEANHKSFASMDLGRKLSDLITTQKVPDDVRFAAMDALMRVDPATGLKRLGPILTDAKAPEVLRERVALTFANSTDREAILDARDYVKDAPYRRVVVITTAMAGSKVGAEVLLDAIKNGKAPARLLQEKLILERLRASSVPNLDKQIADLTRGLPPADVKLAALIKERSAKFVSAKPDKDLGAKLFAKHCAICHKIGDQGAKIGPQLDGIGIRGLERLLEDTLDPNRNVDAAFRARVLNLANGTTKTGLMLRVEGEVVVFADEKGMEFRIPTKEIEMNRETALSPMPANVGEIMTEAEFLHLMGYLLDQKVKDPPKK